MRNDQILDWAIRKVESEYADDVCLLVTYGSYVTGNAGELSDVDFFFVPDSDRAYELMQTFIVEGIGYDLFPVRWERLEKFARFEQSLTPLLGNSRIVYAKSDDCIDRFNQLKDTLTSNLADTEFMHRKAVEKLVQAIRLDETLATTNDPGKVRTIAGNMLIQLADAVAYENRTYLKNGLKTIYFDLSQMPKLPAGFLTHFESVIKAHDLSRLRDTLFELVSACRLFLGFFDDLPEASHLTESPDLESDDIDYLQLAALYREIISTFNKVYKYGANGDYINAFISAVSLQTTLDQETGSLQYDVMGTFTADNLNALFERTKLVETNLVDLIETQVKIRRFKSAEEFIREN